MRLDRFRNTYRVPSARLAGWDYTSAGWYAVTMCTKNRACCLGVVEDASVQLSRCGQIVADEWERTSVLRPNVSLGAWIVMPNHVHGIIVIRDPETQPDIAADTRDRSETNGDRSETFQRNVSKDRASPGADGSLETSPVVVPDVGAPAARLKANSLGSIIGQFKGASTRRILAEGFRSFSWQPRFYDHVIRTDDALDAIRTYVSNNPLKWELDEFNPRLGTGIDDDRNPLR